jgi:hypothetical protein
MKQLITVLIIIWASSQMSAQHKTFKEKTGEKWSSTLNWSIKNPSYSGNPFDIQARAVFFHMESGQTIATPLFYDGDESWKFRFTGMQSGEWKISTYSQDNDLDAWTGTVFINKNKNSKAHGFIKAFGNKWGWQGPESAFIPQYVMGKRPSAYLDDGKVNTDKIKEDIKEFVKAHGFTGFHIPVKGRWFDGENPNPQVYRVVEKIIQDVHSQGGACHIWLWGSGGGGEDGSGPEAFAESPKSKIDKRNLRYLAARLGPLPGWSMGYGFDTENGWARPEQLDEWKAFLEKHMGWDHFLGARVGYDEKGLWAVDPRPPRPPHDANSRSPIADKYTTWLGGDYTGYTSYRPLYPRYKEVIQHHPDKPSFEEDRFRLRKSEQWSYKDYTPELTRRGLWHSAMAGGVANIWGNLLPDDHQEGSQPYDIKEQIKTYSRFFENRFLKEMVTLYDGPELRLMVPEGEHAIVYRENTTVINLDLRRLEGKQPAIAVDTKKSYKEVEIGSYTSGNHTWEAPYRSDWAIAVGEFN